MKKRIPILSLIALLLAGCTSSVSSAGSVTSIPATSTQESVPSSSEDIISDDQSNEESSSSSSSSPVIVQTEWEDSVKEVIISSGITIDIPYVPSFGSGCTATIEDSSGYILIETDTVLYNEENEEEDEYLSSFVSSFDGWEYSIKDCSVYGHYYTSSKMIEFVSDDGTVIIDIFGDKPNRSAKQAYLTMVLRSASKWDPDEFDTYSDDITSCFDDYLDGHSVPDIYLGSKEPTGEYHFNYSYRSYLRIDGGDYHDAVKKEAEQKLLASGFTVDADADVTDFIGFWAYSSGLTATKTYDDHCTLYIEIGDVGYLSPKIQLRAYLIENYEDAHTSSSWKDSTLSLMKSNFLSEEIPYVYLGAEHENCAYLTNTNIGDYLLIHGGEWNDQILEDSVTAFEDAGYIVRTGTRADTLGQWAKGKAVIARKTLADKSLLTVEIGYSGMYNVPMMQAFLQPAWNVPQDKNAFNENTLNSISSFVKSGTEIPYTYLGTDTNGTEIETCGVYSTYYMGDCLLLSGGVYRDTFMEYAKSVYQDAGWVISASPYWSYRTGFTAVYTNEEGYHLEVQVGCDYYGMINLLVFYEDKITIPSDASYPEDISTLISDAFGSDVTIPYLYQGEKKQSARLVTGSLYGDYIEITGGERGELLLDNAAEVLSDAGFNVVSGGTSITTGSWSYGYPDGYFAVVGTKESGDYIYSVEVGQNSNSESVIRIYKKKKFTPISSDASYDDDLSDMLKEITDDHSIPFVYLNSDDPTYLGYYSSYDGYFLTGGLWDSQLVSIIEEELEEEGYEVTITHNNGEKSALGENSWCYGASVLIRGTITYEDGCSITIEVGDYYSEYAYMRISYDSPYRYDGSFEGYPSDITQYFEYYIHGFTLPEIYVGKAYNTYYYISEDEFIIQGTSWDDDCVTDAKNILEQDGWSVTYDESDLSLGLTATKKNSLGEDCNLTLSSVNGKITLTFQYDESEGRGDETLDYPQFIKDQMVSSVGFDIPYVFTGKKNAYFYSSEGYCYFYIGENFDAESSIIDMQNDPDHEWTMVSGTGENDKYYVYVADDGNGGSYVVTIGKQGDEYGYLYMQHRYQYEQPEADANWSDEIQNAFYDKFSTAIPYADLGLGTIDSIIYDDYVLYVASNSLITQDYDDLYSYSITAFRADENWSVSEYYDADGHPYFVAEKDMGDYIVTVTYGYYAYFGPKSQIGFEVTRSWKYILPQSDGEWNSSVKSYFDSYFGDDIEVPWLYLGCPDDNVIVYSYSTSTDMIIQGGTWDDSMVLTIAGKLQYNGWTVSYDSTDLGAGLTATKTGESGKTYTLTLSYDSTIGAYIEIEVSEP